MKPAIKIQNLSKQYRLGVVGTGTLSHDLKRWWHLVRGKEDPYLKIGESNDRSSKGNSEYVWALKDISLDVMPGEIMGIIGKNGAGKSTLLKILSKVTGPTTGNITFKGRIGSLLEVGTGFHQELTGRENIYLNGAILGMTKSEIKKKFDEIVDFSGVERYIDTPVKRYSSGMTVRLGFAVAAFLEPEILVVDEVLAVGDAEFQKKAIGKMQDVSKNEGRTVLFVSHNMTSIQTLCTNAILLNNGEIEGNGTVKSIINQYLGGKWNERPIFQKNNPDIRNKQSIIVECRLEDFHSNLKSSFATYEDIFISIKWKNITGVKVNPNFMLLNRQGDTVMVAIDAPCDWDGGKKSEKGIYKSNAKIPGNLLNANDYFLHIALDSGSPRICYDVVQDALSFNVYDPMDEKCLGRGNFTSVREDAILLPALEWNFQKVI